MPFDTLIVLISFQGQGYALGKETGSHKERKMIGVGSVTSSDQNFPPADPSHKVSHATRSFANSPSQPIVANNLTNHGGKAGRVELGAV
jgi:hypothetical protein